MIQTCLFDMGNVLVLFSHDVMCQQIADLFDVSAEDVHDKLFGSDEQIKFEKGLISETEFHREMEKTFGKQVDFDALVKAAADIFQVNPGITAVLDALKKQGIRLVLLSNTCVSHMDHIHRQFDVLERFDDIVLSYEVHAMKPEPEIFEHAIAAIGCLPEHCFYTDDIEENIDVARAFGLNADVFTTVEKLKEDLIAVGVEIT